MRSIEDTLAGFAALRGGIGRPGTNAPGRLRPLSEFGSNPGGLEALTHVPADLPKGAALVVVLHGCTQSAAAYDRGSGWSELAAEEGFAVLFPEQQRANNPNLCFNWFNAEDTRRGAGEVLSIRQMVATMVSAHGIDPARIFVTGLSAGGAMASALLATYPDVFAGGAVIAGLPYGIARSIPEALDRMRAPARADSDALGALVQNASEHDGPWPTLSVWHGDRDATVSPANASLIVEQWRGLHGVPEAPSETAEVAGHARRLWRDAEGRAVIEEYRIEGLAHGTPLSAAGPDPCGVAGPYMLEAGISSTRLIARFWGLLGEGETRTVPAVRREAIRPTETRARAAARVEPAGPVGVGRIIEDALRAAGLMR